MTASYLPRRRAFSIKLADKLDVNALNELIRLSLKAQQNDLPCHIFYYNSADILDITSVFKTEPNKTTVDEGFFHKAKAIDMTVGNYYYEVRYPHTNEASITFVSYFTNAAELDALGKEIRTNLQAELVPA